MGIERLAEYCAQHKLSKEARFTKADAAKKMVLVVKGNDLLYKIFNPKKNDPLFGGQWQALTHQLTRFVAAFTQVGIELHVIFNGVESVYNQTLAGMRVEARQGYHSLSQAVASNETSKSQYKLLLPFKAERKLELILKSMNVKTMRTIYDANKFIAHYCFSNRYYGVLADDSDFLVMPVPRYFLLQSLKIDKEGISMQSIHTGDLASSLKLHFEQLPVLACLLGNDYIPPPSLLYDALGLDTVEKVAGYVAKFENNEARLLEDFLFLFKDPKQKADWQSNFKLAREQFDLTVGYPAFASHPRYAPFVEVDEDLLRAHWNADVDTDLLRVLHSGVYDCTGRVEPRVAAAAATRNLRRLTYGVLFTSSKLGGRLDDEELARRGAFVEELELEGNTADVRRTRVLPLFPPAPAQRTRADYLKLSRSERAAAFLALLGIEHNQLGPLLPSAAMLFCVSLHVLTREALIHEFELDAALAHFALLPNEKAQQVVINAAGENMPLDANSVQFATLIASTLDAMALLNEVCGFAMPITAEFPWNLYDGRLLHASLFSARAGATIEKLCAGDAAAGEVARTFKSIIVASGARMLTTRSTAEELAELRKHFQALPRPSSTPSLQKSSSGTFMRGSGNNELTSSGSGDSDVLPRVELTTPRSEAASRVRGAPATTVASAESISLGPKTGSPTGNLPPMTTSPRGAMAVSPAGRPPPGLPNIRHSQNDLSSLNTNNLSFVNAISRTQSGSSIPVERPLSPQPSPSRGPASLGVPQVALRASSEKPIASPAKFKPRDETCMYVKNLPDNVTSAEILGEFSRHGKIVRVNVQRGAAVVEFETEEALERALGAGQGRVRDRTYLTHRATLRASASDLVRSAADTANTPLAGSTDSAAAILAAANAASADAASAPAPAHPQGTSPGSFLTSSGSVAMPSAADYVRVEARTWKALLALNSRLALNIVALEQKLDATSKQLLDVRSALADNELLLAQFRQIVDQVHSQNGPASK